jgi:hypothetical protein
MQKRQQSLDGIISFIYFKSLRLQNCSEVGNIHGIPIDGSADDKLPFVMTTADYKASTHDFMDDIAPP